MKGKMGSTLTCYFSKWYGTMPPVYSIKKQTLEEMGFFENTILLNQFLTVMGGLGKMVSIIFSKFVNV